MNTIPEIKTRPKAYRDLREQRLPIKTAQNMRHSHSISTTREIPRLGWKPLDRAIAKNRRSLEAYRLRLANWKFLIPPQSSH
jgi:hypothetical protein